MRPKHSQKQEQIKQDLCKHIDELEQNMCNRISSLCQELKELFDKEDDEVNNDLKTLGELIEAVNESEANLRQLRSSFYTFQVSTEQLFKGQTIGCK